MNTTQWAIFFIACAIWIAIADRRYHSGRYLTITEYWFEEGVILFILLASAGFLAGVALNF